MQKVKEHYVPQFYLNKFTDDNGLLHIYDLKQKKFYTQKPKNICYKKNLYETEWQDANPKLGKYVLANKIENEFCRFESEFAILLQKIIDICTSAQNPNAMILYGKEKEVLFRFVVNLMVRNPLFMESLALSEIPEEIKNSDEMSLFRADMCKMGLGGADSIYLAAQKEVMFTDEIEGSFPYEYAKYLKKISFTFFYSLNSDFITSDMPVLLGNDCMISDEIKTYLYLALSPKIAILFGNYNLPQIRKNKMIKIESEIVDLFNIKILKHHNNINMLIGNSREMIEKYV
ncbi:MAG: DUF4238 domain-containing protein [Lachnospiraceae bacterium]|nr:DUF4238 domain-containing protein [Lachnospiraceae bacterium]